MAINFAGLLSGIGQGLQSFSEQQRLQRAQDLQVAQQERQFKEQQAQGLRSFALSAQQAKLAEARERRMEEALLGTEANRIYQRINDLAALDREDEAKTLSELSQVGLSQEYKDSLVAERAKRHAGYGKQIEELSSLPEIVKRYKNVRGVFTPSRIAAEGFVMPKPKISGPDAINLVMKERASIEGMPEEAKPQAAARARNMLSELGIDKSVLDKFIAPYGSLLGYAEPTSETLLTPEGLVDLRVGRLGQKSPAGTISPEDIVRSFATEQYGLTPEQFNALKTQSQISAGIAPVVKPSGQRVLGAIGPQGVTVTREEPIKETFTTPEQAQLKVLAAKQNLDIANELRRPNVRRAYAAALNAELDALLKGKGLEWYDRKASADIRRGWGRAKAAATGASSAVSDLKAYVAEMVHSRAAMGIQLDMAEFQMKLNEAETRRLDDAEREATRLRTEARKAGIIAGQARTKGQEPARQAAQQMADFLDARAKEIEDTVRAARSGNLRQINNVFGGALVDTGAGQVGLMGALSRPLQERIMQGVTGGVAGFRSGLQQQPAPAPAPAPAQGGGFVFAPNIYAGSGAAPTGAGGAASPSPGGGVGGWWPGGGRFDPTKEPGINPARILAYQQKYPNVKPDTVAGYVRGFLQPDGKLPAIQEQFLADLNAKGKNAKPGQDKPSGGRPEPSAEKPVQGPVKPGSERESEYYSAWTVPGSNKPYNGPTMQWKGKTYPMTDSEFVAKFRNKPVSEADLPRPLERGRFEFVPEKRSAWTVPGSNKPYNGPTMQWKGKTYPMTDSEFSSRFSNKPVTEADLPRPLERGRF